MESNINKATAQQIASFIERAERLHEEQKALAGDLKELWIEAKSVGFDVAQLKEIIKLRRKDPDKLQETEAIKDTYLHALGALLGSPLGDWAREHMAAESRARTAAVLHTSGVTSASLVEAFEATYASDRARETEAAE